MAGDLDALVQLSHALHRLASAYADDGREPSTASAELAAVAVGHREALAMALSYALRTQALQPGAGRDRAVSLLAGALATG